MRKKALSLSTKTNLLLCFFLGLGCLSHYGYSTFIPHVYGAIIMNISLYGLSGSITNSLAITMIFEKIPFIWGSGLIEKNFKKFQENLTATLLTHLFSKGLTLESLDVELISDKLYDRLQQSELVLITRFITPESLTALLRQMKLPELINQSIPPDSFENFVREQVEKLSPNDLKVLILKIIEEHLEWLILWGAAFGILIGIISVLLIG
jgi:uncharacterized membrane protein YheB (UPF0754 family)